jgi:hypothetical protein
VTATNANSRSRAETLGLELQKKWRIETRVVKKDEFKTNKKRLGMNCSLTNVAGVVLASTTASPPVFSCAAVPGGSGDGMRTPSEEVCL